MRPKEDTYYPPIRMNLPGFIIDVYRPILTDEERERRMNEIKKAAARLVLSGMQNEQRATQ